MSGDSVIEVRDLTYRYGERPALAGVSFEVRGGERVGLLGPNGSGKSTLFRILSTLIQPQGGQASVAGASVRERPADVRRKLGVVFQSPALDRQLTVRENLRHHGHLFGLRGALLDARIEEGLHRAGLADRAADRVGALSGGQQRRVDLARAMLHEPPVLLLDEPGTGLDPVARRGLGDQLRAIQSQRAVTILLTTHILDEAERCDRLVLLDRGCVIDAGTPEALKREIAGDCIVVRTADPDSAAREIGERLGLTATPVDETLRIEAPRGHEWIGRIIELLGPRLESVTVSRPTLEDVFIHRTGHRLAAEVGAA